MLNPHGEPASLTVSPLSASPASPASLAPCCRVLQAGNAPSLCYDLQRLKCGTTGHWGRWWFSFLFMFFPYWKLVLAPGAVCPSEEGWERSWGRVRGRSSENSHQEKFSPGSPVFSFFVAFLSIERNMRGVCFWKPCAGKRCFSYLWAVQPSVPISSWFPVIFSLPFIKINMQRNHIFY